MIRKNSMFVMETMSCYAKLLAFSSSFKKRRKKKFLFKSIVL